MDLTEYNYNILLADDDLDDCLFFREALNELGFPGALSMVYNGEELIRYLHNIKQLPDILFLDLNMPKKNGFRCLQEIKKDENLKQLPVVIISTSAEQTIANELLQAGAVHYVEKPSDPEDLKHAIHKIFRKVFNK